MAQVQERKGGPYTKGEREKRQKEVFRLHFEYGYSASQISKMMHINRNTISKDISSLHSKLNEEMDKENFNDWVNKQFARLESQRAMLRKELDKEITLKEKLQISKMLQSLDWKIMSLLIKLKSTNETATDAGVAFVNHWLEKQGHKERYMSRENLYRLPEKKIEKILKLINGE